MQQPQMISSAAIRSDSGTCAWAVHTISRRIASLMEVLISHESSEPSLKRA